MKIVDELVIGIGNEGYVQSNIVDERQWDAIIVSEEPPPPPPSEKPSPWPWIGVGAAILVGAAAIGARKAKERK